jgi:hypothetical protein
MSRAVVLEGASVRVAGVVAFVAASMLLVACKSEGDRDGDGGADDRDARYVPLDAAPPPDLAATGNTTTRDAAPYERPPLPPTVSGHGWSWKSLGVTPADLGGMRLQTNDRIILRAGGAGVGASADGLGLAYAKLEGDGEIVARVRSLQMANPQAMAGVIIRADDADDGAPSVFLGVLAEEARGGRIVVRRTAKAAAEVLPSDANIRAGQFLRIRREGRLFTCYRSVDRLGWVRLYEVEVDMPATVIAGVAATAAMSGPVTAADGGTAAAVTVAELDQLRLLQVDQPAAALALDLEPLVGNGAIATVKAGAVSISGGGDQLVSVGEPAIGLFAPLHGNQTITARIDAIGGAMAPRARVGLSFREGGPARVSPLARHALLSLDAAGTLAFQKRDRSTNFDPGASLSGITPPCWLRLARYDDPQALRTRVMGSYSLDGVTFVPLDTVEMPLADPALGGLLFTSGDQRIHANARLSGFSIVPTSTPIAAPAADAGGDAGPRDAGGGS